MTYVLGFYKNRNRFNPLSRLIELETGSDISHVEVIKINNSITDSISYGSTWPKSRAIVLNDLIKTHELKETIHLNVISNAKAEIIIRGQLGKPYSILQLVIIFLSLAFKHSIKWLPFVKLNLDQALICTEFAAIVMRDACNYVVDGSPETKTFSEIKAIAYSNLNK